MKSRNQSKMTFCWISNNNYRQVEITIFVGGILERKKKQQKKTFCRKEIHFSFQSPLHLLHVCLNWCINKYVYEEIYTF